MVCKDIVRGHHPELTNEQCCTATGVDWPALPEIEVDPFRDRALMPILSTTIWIIRYFATQPLDWRFQEREIKMDRLHVRILART